MDVGALSNAGLELFCSNIAYAKNSKTALLSLPAELRDQIWRLALVGELQDQQQYFNERMARQGRARLDRGEHFLENLLGMWLYPDIDQHFSPRPPIFVNACGQLKKEAEFILYTDVMVFMEQSLCAQNHEFELGGQFWRYLKAHEVSALSAESQFRIDGRIQRMGIRQGPDLEPLIGTIEQTAAALQYERAGIVTFAEDCGISDKIWTAGENMAQLGIERKEGWLVVPSPVPRGRRSMRKRYAAAVRKGRDRENLKVFVESGPMQDDL